MILSASPAGFPRDIGIGCDVVVVVDDDVVNASAASFTKSETGGYIVSLCIWRRLYVFLEPLEPILFTMLLLLARREEERDTSNNGRDDDNGSLIKECLMKL